MPRLLSYERSLSVLVTSALDGEVVKTMQGPLSPSEEQEIHRAAGYGVRRLHRLRRDNVSRQDADELRERRLAELLEDAGRHLDIAAAVLTTAETETIGRARDVLLQHAGTCEVGFIHADFQPRNWLWSGATRTIGFIDFEESRLGFCFEDFAWLLGALWHRRPDLRVAFWKGYGRRLEASERLSLAAFTALGGLLHIADGCELHIRQKIDNGRAALAVASEAMG